MNRDTSLGWSKENYSETNPSIGLWTMSLFVFPADLMDSVIQPMIQNIWCGTRFIRRARSFCCDDCILSDLARTLNTFIWQYWLELTFTSSIALSGFWLKMMCTHYITVSNYTPNCAAFTSIVVIYLSLLIKQVCVTYSIISNILTSILFIQMKIQPKTELVPNDQQQQQHQPNI